MSWFWSLLCARSCVKARLCHLTKLDKSLKNRHYFYSHYCYCLHCTNEETEGQRVRRCVQGGSVNEYRVEPGFSRLHVVALHDFYSIFLYTHIKFPTTKMCDQARYDYPHSTARKLWLRKVK